MPSGGFGGSVAWYLVEGQVMDLRGWYSKHLLPAAFLKEFDLISHELMKIKSTTFVPSWSLSLPNAPGSPPQFQHSLHCSGVRFVEGCWG